MAQVSGSISGYVKDKTGAPVPGCFIEVDGTAYNAVTDEAGYFTINNIEPASYNITASMTGFGSVTLYNVIIKSVGNPEINFELTETSEELTEVVVTKFKTGRTTETPLSVQSLTAVEIANYPGSNNDVVRVAQTLPGVSPSIGGFRNDLIIRGGAPNETVYYLDGMEVPNINHFSTQGSSGGPVGMLNVSFIQDVTLSTSAFGAQYDNPLSGVLQFRQRNGNTNNFNGNVRLSASELALTLEGPLFKSEGKESKTSFIASVRRSYLQFLFQLIELPIRPDYWDYQYKVTHKIDDYNSISLLGLGSIDDFSVEAPDDFDEEQQATLEQVPYIEQRTNTTGITWNRRFKNGNGNMQTTLSNNYFQNTFTRYEDNENQEGVLFSNDAKEIEYKLRNQTTFFINNWKLSAGFNTQWSDYTNITTDITDNNFYRTDIDFLKYGLFANLSGSVTDDLNVSFGVRADDDTFTGYDNLFTTISPRLSLSYRLTDKLKINSSVGRYFKLPPYTILGYRENNILLNENAAYTKSDHYVVGLEYMLSNSAWATLEGFYKRYNNFPVSLADQVSLANKGAGFEVLGNEAVATTGSGRTYGLELFVQQKLTDNFFGVFSYTFFFSEFTGTDNSQYLPSVWDSRHLLSFTGGYKFKKNWEVSSRFRFAGKTPFVPIDTQASLQTYPEFVFNYNNLGDEKLDVFNQLDVRIDKKFNFSKFSLNIFAEAENILAQAIPQPPQYILSRNNDGSITEPPSLSTVNTSNNQIIPSIGIVLDF
jgi:outer membrane receptor for ferrienterochelin and colicin